ncbi:hypothetical protein Tco_1512587, partial [Tanacetum coccineum]
KDARLHFTLNICSREEPGSRRSEHYAAKIIKEAEHENQEQSQLCVEETDIPEVTD